MELSTRQFRKPRREFRPPEPLRKLELTTSGIRATGSTYQLNFGANPYGYLDVSYLTYADNEVFVGAGFRSYDDGERTKTMAAYIGTIP